jgi:hypothetical protein
LIQLPQRKRLARGLSTDIILKSFIKKIYRYILISYLFLSETLSIHISRYLSFLLTIEILMHPNVLSNYINHDIFSFLSRHLSLFYPNIYGSWKIGLLERIRSNFALCALFPDLLYCKITKHSMCEIRLKGHLASLPKELDLCRLFGEARLKLESCTGASAGLSGARRF